MKKKFLPFLMIFLITSIMTSTVGAGGNVKLSGVRFALGSLIAEGFVRDSGNVDITIVLDATGIASITCTHPESENVPGGKDVQVSASGEQTLYAYGGSEASGTSESGNNNKRAFSVETVDPESLPWDVAGCPSSEWSAQVDFISWKTAKISVFDATSSEGAALLKEPEENPDSLMVIERYGCRTNWKHNTVSCQLAGREKTYH